MVLGFNRGAGVVLAANLGATHCRLAVADLGAQLLGELTADRLRPAVRFRLPSPGVWGRLPAEEVVSMDMEGFRDKADDALAKGEEEVDERTGGRFDEQTDRAADEVRERGEGVLGDQQQGDQPQQ